MPLQEVSRRPLPGPLRDGVVAKGKDLKAYKNRDWVDVTATVRKEYIEAYQGEGPVLYVDKITTCAKPAQEVVSF